MMSRIIARLTVWLLTHATLKPAERQEVFDEVVDLFRKKLLSIEERQILTALLLEKLGALPLRAKIVVDKTGMVSVNGRSLDPELAMTLQQAAVAMQRNAARNLVRETVTYLAIVDGTIKSINPEMMLFAKAALWFLQQEDELYATLAQEGLGDE